MKVKLVNQRVNEIDNTKPDGLINIHAYKNMASVYDNKEQSKLHLQLKRKPK